MSKYQICLNPYNSEAEQVRRLADKATIFKGDGSSADWRVYQDWLAEGNTPLPAEGTEITWDTIRAKRDQLIADSDWTMIPGATVDQAAWAAYRQVLRDLPQTYAATGPESVVWPAEPSTAGPNTTTVE